MPIIYQVLAKFSPKTQNAHVCILCLTSLKTCVIMGSTNMNTSTIAPLPTSSHHPSSSSDDLLTPASHSFVIIWQHTSVVNELTTIAYIFCINKQNYTKEQLENIIIKSKGGRILDTKPVAAITSPTQVIAFENFIRPSDIINFSQSAAEKCKLTKEEFEYVKSQWKDLQGFELKLLKYAKLI